MDSLTRTFNDGNVTLDFIRDETLRNLKYGVRYNHANPIHVSPAVFELLNTDDAEVVAKNLRIKEVKK